MKRIRTILCSIMLIIAVATPSMAATVPYNMVDRGSGQVTVDTRVNPLYDGGFGEEGSFDRVEVKKARQLYSGVNKSEFAETESAAATVLRQKMAKRDENPVVKLHVHFDQFPSDNDFSDYVNNRMEIIFEEACMHTGKSDEGDALKWAWKTWGGGVEFYYEDNDFYLTYNYVVDFYVTPEQEAEFLAAKEQVKQSLTLEGKSDYEKIKAIYEYICGHVAYDFDNLNKDYDLKFTDYAALVHGTSVCQGYALLFYRLALDYGIDNRVISGYGGVEPHGWNIVKLGDLYYCVDATWDSIRDPDEFFLKGSNVFHQDHFCDATYHEEYFQKAYPVSMDDYNGVLHTHNLVTTSFAGDCKTEGWIKKVCNDCSYAKTQWTGYGKHVPGDGPTCDDGQYCKVCERELAGPLEHVWGNDYICDRCGTENAALKPQEPPAEEVVPDTPAVTPDVPSVTPGQDPTPEVTPDTTVHVHNYVESKTKAQIGKNGKVVTACSSCGDVASSKTIYKISSYKLSFTESAYNGKKKSPKVVVKDSQGKTLKEGTDYTVTRPSGRKSVGKYTYTVKFKGNYTGTKKLYLTVKPVKPTALSPKVSKKAVTVKWKKVKSQASGYQIVVATDSKFKKNKKTITVKRYKTTSKKVTKLKAKKKYYVRVRTYKTVKGVKIYSDWSKVKSCKTK